MSYYSIDASFPLLVDDGKIYKSKIRKIESIMQRVIRISSYILQTRQEFFYRVWEQNNNNFY